MQLTCRTNNCGQRFRNMSTLRKHAWAAHPETYNQSLKKARKAKAAKALLETQTELASIPKEFIKDLGDDGPVEVGFDNSEHRLIKLACLNMRESLDAILYKLQIMDVPEKK